MVFIASFLVLGSRETFVKEIAILGGGYRSISRPNYKSFKGINVTISEGLHQFIMYILKVVQPVRRGRSVRGGGGGAKGFFNSFRSHRCRGLLYAWC